MKMTGKLVGTNFAPRAETILKSFRTDAPEPIFLRRDPKNKFDANAIRVLTRGGDELGYVDRNNAKNIAPELDRRMPAEGPSPFSALLDCSCNPREVIIDLPEA